MSSQTTTPSRVEADYRHPIAFSVQLSRNVIVQTFGLGMVSLVGLSVLPWRIVLVWALIAVAAVGAENHFLRRLANGETDSPIAGHWSRGLRILTTSLYALAAFALISRGGPGERLFAFALISASMVNVLMRYYRSPLILMASLAPYLIVLGWAGFGLTRQALGHGNVFAPLAPSFTIIMFAVQFWSARAQLSAAWLELKTARETAETRERAAEAANRAKSQFLANMSHELRTPLNGVLGMAQALATEPLSKVQKERLSIIRRSSETLLSVLNDLLDLSKIEASTLDLELGDFDLEHLVRGVVAAYRPLAAKKSLSFEFTIAPEACGQYLGDSGRIRRILYALADNAVKFTETGGVTLDVARDGDVITFRVVDTGIGIDQDDLAHLFEGFFQADATRARRYGGTGVGLAICSELAQRMGGSIQAAGARGSGSAFTFRLPMTPAEAPIEAARPPAPTHSVEGGRLQVLAAEDNLTNQLVLKTLLEAAGITPTLVENGREALAAWESQPWDIVLMDIQMPEMDGVDATRAIRSRELAAGRSRTPIVAVTANAMTHQLIEYQAAGIDGVVAKPIDLANLFSAMEQALAQPAAKAAAPQMAS